MEWEDSSPAEPRSLLQRLRPARSKATSVKPVLVELWKNAEGMMLQEMKCSMCKEVVPAPLQWACTQGHPICSECSVTVPKCPWEPPRSKDARNMCCSGFAPTRLKIYDLIYNKSKFECKFKAKGCGVEPEGSFWEQHSRTCPYNPINDYNRDW